MPGAFDSGFDSGFDLSGVAPPASGGEGFIRVEIAFTSQANPDAWNLGLDAFPVTLGDALTEAWTDVTPFAKSLSINRGKARELDAYQVGRCSVGLQNILRRFDPLNLDGPYVEAGETLVKPGKPMRVIATDPTDDVEYPLFRGTITDWGLDYSGAFNAITTATASDALALLPTAGINYTTSSAFTGVVVSQLLEEAGISQNVIDVGDVLAQGMTWTGTLAQALRNLEQTEQGHLYSPPDGGITYRERGYAAYDPRATTSQASFGATGLPYESIALSYDSDAIKNKARVTRRGGTRQEFANVDSIAEYGERLITLTDLACLDDAAAEALAEFVVDQRGDPKVRIDSIVCAPIRSPEVLTTAISTRILDRITVDFIPPGATSPYSQDVFVIGIAHSWTPPGAMRTTFRFMPVGLYAGPWWVLGVGELGDTEGPTVTRLGV